MPKEQGEFVKSTTEFETGHIHVTAEHIPHALGEKCTVRIRGDKDDSEQIQFDLSHTAMEIFLTELTHFFMRSHSSHERRIGKW